MDIKAPLRIGDLLTFGFSLGTVMPDNQFEYYLQQYNERGLNDIYLWEKDGIIRFYFNNPYNEQGIKIPDMQHLAMLYQSLTGELFTSYLKRTGREIYCDIFKGKFAEL